MHFSSQKEIIIPPNNLRSFQLRGVYFKTKKKQIGRILFLPGFTEPCEKYFNLSKKLMDLGYSSLIVDWPGQGKSGHLGKYPTIIHCDSFDLHINCLIEIIQNSKFKDKEFSIIGHSMGGHLALIFSKKLNYKIKCLILIAPMFVPKSASPLLVIFLSFILIKFGFSKKNIPFIKRKTLDDRRIFHIDNPLTRSKKGYDIQFKIFEKNRDLERYEPSIGWIYSAFLSCLKKTLKPVWLKEIKLPILFLLAGDERIVDQKKTLLMLKNFKNKQVKIFKNARHDLKNETSFVKSKLFNNIIQFLKKN